MFEGDQILDGEQIWIVTSCLHQGSGLGTIATYLESNPKVRFYFQEDDLEWSDEDQRWITTTKFRNRFRGRG